MHGLIKYMNTCISQQVFSIHIQSKQDTLISGKNENILDNFGLHEDKDFILEEQDIKGDYRNLVDKSSDTESHIRNGLSKWTTQDRLFASESLLSLIEIRFSKLEFSTNIPISDIKYQHPSSQNNNSFYLFNNQLDYALITFFTESETIKGNVNRFLLDPLMALYTEKLFY